MPTVLLVLEGGPGTLGTIHSAVTGDNPVPVVVVKSSGRAADLLVYALTLSSEILEANKVGVHAGLMDVVNKIFPGLKDKGKVAYNQILECLKFKGMVSVHNVSSFHFLPHIRKVFE